MIYANPNASFEATSSWGATGLVGTITVAVYDGVGGTTIAPQTTGIVEVAAGTYTATLTAPGIAGQYTIVWSDGVETASDELTVTTSVSIPIVPVPGPGMTVGEMLDGILLDRFEADHRPRALKALNNRYAQLWALEDWTWKYAEVPITLTGNNQYAGGLPADFGVPMYVWDENHNQLPYLGIDEFRLYYPPAVSAYPVAWTVIAQQILLGPTPSSAMTFSTYYRKRLVPFTSEGETPQIPVEFQLALVHGGRAELLAFYNDPTSADMEAQYQLDVQALQRDYLADATGQPAMWSSDLMVLTYGG
jgi:hypothetical protein